MEINNMTTISPDTLKTEYVSPDECIFSKNNNGFLSAEIKSVKYNRVILTRALPLSQPDEYIAISDVEKKELGIIQNLSDFSSEQQALINGEISSRYFCPKVTEILSVKEKFGHIYFDVKIGTFKKNFTVRDITKNIRYHGKGFDLIDVDGNRYCFDEFDSMPSKYKRKLEPYLY